MQAPSGMPLAQRGLLEPVGKQTTLLRDASLYHEHASVTDLGGTPAM